MDQAAAATGAAGIGQVAPMNELLVGATGIGQAAQMNELLAGATGLRQAAKINDQMDMNDQTKATLSEVRLEVQEKDQMIVELQDQLKDLDKLNTEYAERILNLPLVRFLPWGLPRR